MERLAVRGRDSHKRAPRGVRVVYSLLRHLGRLQAVLAFCTRQILKS
jgi:hypothetical protein